jgi:serine/threonine protein kinase
MVTREGRVKVLDFGLSKIELGGGPANNLTLTETLEAPATAAGQVLGTVPYMSPEQLRGEPVDARCDLFALGIILYELATGRRPFTGCDPGGHQFRDPARCSGSATERPRWVAFGARPNHRPLSGEEPAGPDPDGAGCLP